MLLRGFRAMPDPSDPDDPPPDVVAEMLADSLPVYDPSPTKKPSQVYCALTGKSLGTVSWVRPGTADEACSIKCHLHGAACRIPMKRTGASMSPLGIKHFFRRGLEDCADGKPGAALHMAIFYTCLKDYPA